MISSGSLKDGGLYGCALSEKKDLPRQSPGLKYVSGTLKNDQRFTFVSSNFYLRKVYLGPFATRVSELLVTCL